MQYISRYCSPLGEMLMASDGSYITGLWFEQQKYYGSTLEAVYEEQEIPLFRKTKKWLAIYFSGKEPDFALPLAPEGTEFQRSVWDMLCQIPYGETVTYGEIAGEIARRRGVKKFSAQAVGNAVGHNPISILVPCHRVIGADGSLTGYAGGIDKKKALLELECMDM